MPWLPGYAFIKLIYAFSPCNQESYRFHKRLWYWASKGTELFWLCAELIIVKRTILTDRISSCALVTTMARSNARCFRSICLHFHWNPEKPHLTPVSYLHINGICWFTSLVTFSVQTFTVSFSDHDQDDPCISANCYLLRSIIIPIRSAKVACHTLKCKLKR